MNIIHLAAAALLTLIASGSQDALAQERRFTIGTNPPGTLYHVVGSGMAKLLQEKLGRPATAQPGAGSSTYLPLIAQREMTMGLSSSLDSGSAYKGEQGRRPITELRAIARLWPLTYAFIARRSDGVLSVADMKGKRVVVDFKGNAALGSVNLAMLAVAGLKPDDVRAIDVGDLPQGLKALQDGSVDVTAAAVGIPLVKQAHAAVAGGVNYVSLTGPNATDGFLNAQVPGLYTTTLNPGPALPEVTAPVTVSAFDVYLVGATGLGAADVTAILETLSAGWADLRRDHPALRAASETEFARPTNTVPFHPAAVAFFKAKGLWTADNDAREKGF